MHGPLTELPSRFAFYYFCHNILCSNKAFLNQTHCFHGLCWGVTGGRDGDSASFRLGAAKISSRVLNLCCNIRSEYVNENSDNRKIVKISYCDNAYSFNNKKYIAQLYNTAIESSHYHSVPLIRKNKDYQRSFLRGTKGTMKEHTIGFQVN